MVALIPYWNSHGASGASERREREREMHNMRESWHNTKITLLQHVHDELLVVGPERDGHERSR